MRSLDFLAALGDGKPVRFRPILSAFRCACAALAVIISAHGAPLEVEPFDYPLSLGAGLNGLSGGTGWSAAWVDGDSLPSLAPTNLSLDYPTGVPLAESGGRISISGDVVNNPATRMLGTTMGLANNGATFYSSALFRRSAVTGELASVLFDRTTDGVIRWFYGIDTNGFFSVAVDPSNSAQRATSTFAAAANTTYLLVAKIRTNTGAAGADEVFLQVFEEGDLIAEPALDSGWDLRASGGSTVTLERVRLALSNVSGQTNEFDELRIGTSFADVTGVTGVPEPASTALLGIGAVALLRRRRSC